MHQNLGNLKYFLGIEVARSKKGLFLSQRKYILDIINECKLSEAKPCAFPMEQQHQLANDSIKDMKDDGKYRLLVERLLYLTITRPEITYAVHILSQFIQKPRVRHWEVAIWIVKYLKTKIGLGILFPKNNEELKLTGYCDTDWASFPTTRKSITGYFITFAGAPIVWKSKKQATISRSSTESEYRAMTSTVSELIWLKVLFHFLKVDTGTTLLYSDSKFALQTAANPIFHDRTKHIDVDCHFVREKIQRGDITMTYIPTCEQLDDIFTKALGQKQFKYLASKMGVLDPHTLS